MSSSQREDFEIRRVPTSKNAVEPRYEKLPAEDLQRLNRGYDALNKYSNGLYAAFLKEASGCTRCAEDHRIPLHKIPVPLMCGLGHHQEGPEVWRRAHAALDSERCGDTLNFETGEKEAASRVRRLLSEHGLGGLAIGHCGWGDYTARMRADDLARGVKLMILGADWYPIRSCTNFIIDGYDAARDNTFGNFLSRLEVSPLHAQRFFVDHRVYLGNTLLCYRTGTATTGASNLSPRSFKNCRDHLRRHIQAVKPEILVTFGVQPCRSIAAIVTGVSERSERTLNVLRTSKVALRRTMTEAYSQARPRELRVTLNGCQFAFIPLCHPSDRRNSYKRDYAVLRELLGI